VSAVPEEAEGSSEGRRESKRERERERERGEGEYAAKGRFARIKQDLRGG